LIGRILQIAPVLWGSPSTDRGKPGRIFKSAEKHMSGKATYQELTFPLHRIPSLVIFIYSTTEPKE